MNEEQERLRKALTERKTRINMIPLLDVIFILLIFLIMAVVSTTLPKSVELTLPEGPGTDAPDALLIEIDREGNLFFQGSLMSPEEAVATAVSLLQAGEKSVIIRGDAESRLGASVTLVSRLKDAGIASVHFEVTGDE